MQRGTHPYLTVGVVVAAAGLIGPFGDAFASGGPFPVLLEDLHTVFADLIRV